MNLSLLYTHNADLCAQMANRTKSDEVREQWLALADSWHMKAQASDGLVTAPKYREQLPRPAATLLVTATPLAQIATAPPASPDAENLPEETVSIVPEKPPAVLSVSAVDVTTEEPKDHEKEAAAVGDDFWTVMIAEIRGRKPSPRSPVY